MYGVKYGTPIANADCSVQHHIEKSYIYRSHLSRNKCLNHVLCNSGNKLSTLQQTVNVDSNSIDSFNSMVAKFVGGKRINFCMKIIYTSRIHAAVVAFHTKIPNT
ncbi:hypothetical protein PR048_005640, partial [Dryococelus australis]